jgi:presenilin-like A22 family membrane protease
MALLFVIVQVIAITIAPIYSAAESEAMGGRETIENPAFAFGYLGIILVFTFIILYIAKKKKEKFIKYLILAAIFMTMVYLFVPLTIEAFNPDDDGDWDKNEIGFAAVVINAGDVDDDGVLEVVAGCADNRIRIYEAANHTLEWESGEFPGNITQIIINDVDNDGSNDIAVLSKGIKVFYGGNKSEKWNLSFANFYTMILGDWTLNETKSLIAGTNDAKVILFISDMMYYEFDVSSSLNNITYLAATDSERIIASDGLKIVSFNTTTTDVELELEITELDHIQALTVYNNPEGEDLIIAADKKRPYVFDISSGNQLRKGPEFPNVRSFYFEQYDIPDYNDSIPDVLAVSDRNVYISPDLIKSEEFYYVLRTPYDIYGFYTTDLDSDGYKEMILGVDDGYKYTPIVFVEGSLPIIPLIISITAALLLTIVVHKFPEWYVVDIVGLVMAIGAVVILGVTFAILPAIALLAVLAIYDAISVYKTKHMITLADSVIDLNLPVLLVIPKKLGYSYRKEKPRLKEQIKEGKEREAMFMGLGDIVIPSLLIISALTFLPATSNGMGVTNNVLVAIGTMIGILIGFSVLMRYVLKGNPQAGLPLLNSGAIGGYLISYILVFGDFAFGFNLNFM